ncbi:hypothetical protein L3Q82_005177 [Scortum barcoo]|uniref:Uncharacterized protein n=1 Tax=Scortum barcoo TaxID=214431 RepID=A0ACB8V9X1_9TELE|nr:hypothetical protein L3Q82_005177 [Scortum barcoo]
MDRISRRSQGPEGVRFGNHRISSLLFADDVVLLASSSQDLQHVLERFAAECEAAGMRISTSKSEAMALDWKRVACPLQVSGEVLPQVEEFKYLGVFVHEASFLTYSREELLALRTKRRAGMRHPIPAELRRRPRGCKAGAKLKAELAENRRRYMPSIPSVIMGNVNSLPNKIDELSALNNQRIYCES